MSYKSPFADPAAVQKIVSDVGNLSTNSVTIEEDIFQAKANADNLARQYGSDFDILSQVPQFLGPFADKLRTQNNNARDAATKIRAKFDEFVLLLGVIETIKTKEEIEELIGAFNDDIKVKNPLEEKPLEGFPGVTKQFTAIWNLKNDESKNIIDVLGKATDIPKVIKELTDAIKPALEGIAKVQNALRDYASKIRP